ncbi:hypothetical protein OROMI_028381 [Orobanche minor]
MLTFTPIHQLLCNLFNLTKTMSNSKKNMTIQEKNKVAQFLFLHTECGQIQRGIVGKAAAYFQVNRRTINTIWKQTKEQMEAGLPIHLKNRKMGASKRGKKVFDGEKLKTIHLQERGTIRALAEGLNVSPSTAWRYVKDGLIRSQRKWLFKCMNHIVHIDEKWFYLTKSSEKYYLHPDEPDPYRSCKSKKFITKVMFLCAVSRPIYNLDGTLIFDGKIGIFPLTHKVAAKRSSKNRTAGTMETKAIDSITKEVIKSWLINKVLPAIKTKWPLTESTNIVIQQDNARPHITDADIDFRAAASSDGFNIHLVCQPTNSPDLNINDLGWFRALQALQTKRASFNIDDLVDAVELSFTELDHSKLNNVFLSLQMCMIEIMRVKGHNNYRQPHMKKSALMRAGMLPENLEVQDELLKECMQYLVEKDEHQEFNLMTEELYNSNMQILDNN